MKHAARNAEGKIVLHNPETGQVVHRWSVDAQEMIIRGPWVTTLPPDHVVPERTPEERGIEESESAPFIPGREAEQAARIKDLEAQLAATRDEQGESKATTSDADAAGDEESSESTSSERATPKKKAPPKRAGTKRAGTKQPKRKK